jgi:uncharacterized protein
MSDARHPRPLRRAAQEIVDPDGLNEILATAQLLYLSFDDHPAPYVIPVCFGSAPGVLYVHGAKEGAKIDLLRGNPRVGFSASVDVSIVAGRAPCGFSCTGRSIVGTGFARIVEDEEERRRGLDAIMRHYSHAPGELSYEPGSLSRTGLIAIRIETLCGKRIG